MKLSALLVDARKTIAATSGAVAVIVSAGLLSGAAEQWTTSLISAATAFLVYLTPNGAATPPDNPQADLPVV